MGPTTLTFLCLSYAFLCLSYASDIRWIDSSKTEWYNPDDVLTIEAEIETQFFAGESWIAIHIQQCADKAWSSSIGQGPDWGPALEVSWQNTYSGEGTGNYKFAVADVDADVFDHGQSYLWKIIAARAGDSSLVFNVSLNGIQYISFTYIDGVSNAWNGLDLPDDRPHILQISRDRLFGAISHEQENIATTIRWFNVSGAPVISPRDYSCEYVYVESTTTTLADADESSTAQAVPVYEEKKKYWFQILLAVLVFIVAGVLLIWFVWRQRHKEAQADLANVVELEKCDSQENLDKVYMDAKQVARATATATRETKSNVVELEKCDRNADRKQAEARATANATRETKSNVHQDDEPPFVRLLREWGLQQFEKQFAAYGYTNVSVWSTVGLTDAELKNLGLQVGHIKTFQFKCLEMNALKDNDEEMKQPGADSVPSAEGDVAGRTGVDNGRPDDDDRDDDDQDDDDDLFGTYEKEKTGAGLENAHDGVDNGNLITLELVDINDGPVTAEGEDRI